MTCFLKQLKKPVLNMLSHFMLSIQQDEQKGEPDEPLNQISLFKSLTKIHAQHTHMHKQKWPLFVWRRRYFSLIFQNLFKRRTKKAHSSLLCPLSVLLSVWDGSDNPACCGADAGSRRVSSWKRFDWRASCRWDASSSPATHTCWPPVKCSRCLSAPPLNQHRHFAIAPRP